METIFLSLPWIVFFVIIGLVLIKLALFFTYKTKNWKISNLIYFDITHITLTESSKRASIKKWQNSLTVLIILLILFEVWINAIIKTPV